MQIPQEIGSKYRLIVLAGERVAQLQKGALPRLDSAAGMKLTEIALRELLQSKVNLVDKDLEDESSDHPTLEKTTPPRAERVAAAT